MSREERSAWAKNVLENIEREGDILSDRFIILAGDLYYRDWIRYLANSSLPLENLRMGAQIAYLKKLLKPAVADYSNTCVLLCINYFVICHAINRGFQSLFFGWANSDTKSRCVRVNGSCRKVLEDYIKARAYPI